jgi:seryl-tRNA synthetase
MIDLKLLRENPERFRDTMAKRGGAIDFDAILELDVRRRALLHEMEQLRAEQNRASEDIARLKRAKEDAAPAIEAVANIKQQIAVLEEQVRNEDTLLQDALLAVPNLPDDSLPVGKSEADNRVERTWGTPRELDFEPKDHVALGEGLGILDFERATKIAGARFTLSTGHGARLERALINFMLDVHTGEHGYTEVLPPFLVNSESMTGTGQLPKFAADLFHIEASDFWLIPTAEVPVTNIHRDEILPAEALPICYTAYTPVLPQRGRLLRQGHARHDPPAPVQQGRDGEVVRTPETRGTSWRNSDRQCRGHVAAPGAALPVMTLCTGDVGFASAKTYDLEVWLPGQGCYREISSCSNFTDFQARRANIRFKRDKKPEFVHTLNGSGLAVGRTLVAILENYQQADGSVIIPEVLRPYMGGVSVLSV